VIEIVPMALLAAWRVLAVGRGAPGIQPLPVLTLARDVR